MPSKVLLLVLTGFVVLLTACAQRLTTQDDQGFVYYEPKPFLVVAKNMSFGDKPAAAPAKPPEGDKPPKGKEGKVAPRAAAGGGGGAEQATDGYEYRIIYLPRPCPTEPGAYAACVKNHRLRVTNGIGSLKSSVTLENGWMLTSINVENDAQVDEMLASTAEIISSVGGIVGAAVVPVPPADKEAYVRVYDVENQWRCVFAYPERPECRP